MFALQLTPLGPHLDSGNSYPRSLEQLTTFYSFQSLVDGDTVYTLIHVILSLVGLLSGSVVVGGWIAGRRLQTWTEIFLATTIATNATGFGFPFVGLLPSHVVALVSLVVLAVVLIARYVKHLAGTWAAIYTLGGVAALYLNAFVLVVQLFRRLPDLIAAAPTQQELPFVVTQVLLLVSFAWLGHAAMSGLKQGPAAA